MDRLDALRTEIDAVDAALHDLLMKRAELAQRERLSAAAPPFRPARDAEVLRALAARHAGAMAFSSLMRIWREILSGPVEVHFLASEEPLALAELARAHFGSQASFTRAASAAIVLERVRATPGAIGLLPVPGAAAEKWWLKLLSEAAGAPRVVARLPACEPRTPDAARALVVTGRAPEPSGEDRTLLTVEAPAETSPASVERALSVLGRRVHLLDRAAERAHGFFLFEAEGFVTASELPEKVGAPIARIHGVGAYPMPLVWPRGEGAGDVVTSRPGAP